ncbi:hypothetical protein O3M35_001125 [Rhynocoris fuscipes]|uniref:Reverse transcriptase domain-containing protein n=1 Tax=Rhynocoris fuscipes TaxID=488301 RepID=A0AAW1DQ73_9HEMI
MKKDFVERVNDSIKTLLPHKSHFCFDKTGFWCKLYLTFGINFFNYIFDKCYIYIQRNEGQFLSLGKFYPNFGSYCKRSQVVEIREIYTEECGYDRDLNINRIKMMYNNVLKCKSNLVIKKQNILTEVFKQDVGRQLKYDVKQTKMIKNLKKLENSDLCISHARSILKNTLKPKVPIISKKSVLLFLRKILSRIIPNRIFNKKKHFLRFLDNLSLIIERNLGQCVTLGEIMHGVVEGKNLVLQNLCAKIVLWLINESLELVYVLLTHWIKAEKTAMETMITNGHLKKIDSHDYTKNDKRSIDHSRIASLRFVPKDSLNSFRPIIQRSTYQKNTDKFGKTCNIFLKQLSAKDKNAVMNAETNIYKSWKNFNDKTKENTEIYFIKTDIKDAYGSIIHVIII